MNKRPILFLFAGILCAAAAVFVTARYLSKKGIGKAEVSTAKVLLATQAIEYGTKLVPTEGDQKGNVQLVDWPKNFVPEGAVTKVEDVKDKEVFAAAPFVRHQVIVASQVKTKDQFRPADMYPEQIAVDRSELALFKAGNKVDVFRVMEKDKSVEEIVRCAQIYAVGELPEVKEQVKEEDKTKKKEEKETPSVIYLLLPNKYNEAMVEYKQKSKIVVRPAKDACEEGPVFVSVQGETPKTPAAISGELVRVAESLQHADKLDSAAGVLEYITSHYPGTPEAKQAESAKPALEATQSEQMLKFAESALAEKDYGRCLSLCTSLRAKFPNQKKVLDRSAEIEKAAKAVAEESQREGRYRDLVDKLFHNIEKGNFPEARSALNGLKENFADYAPSAAVLPGAKVISTAEPLLKKGEADFDNQKRMLTVYVDNREKQKAVDKLNQLKEKYPEHPGIKELENELRQKGFLAPEAAPGAGEPH